MLVFQMTEVTSHYTLKNPKLPIRKMLVLVSLQYFLHTFFLLHVELACLVQKLVLLLRLG